MARPSYVHVITQLHRCLIALHIFFFCFTIPPGACKETEAYTAGSHYLHKIKWPERRKNASPAVTSTSSNLQSRHMPREPHTNWDGIFLCVLPYLTINDFSWFRSFVFWFTIPPGTCKEVEACRAGSHNLHKLNDLNTQKIPAQRWLECACMIFSTYCSVK